MTLEKLTRDSGHLVRQYTYGDERVLAIDFGASGQEASVDVADGTVIVVLEDDQYEFDLPDETDEAHTFMKNGVLSIELEAQR
ncbi:DUF7127 family protein [Natronobiforma cellulositropha]|uniref:DUF7127 family protein n=1 Tax=Natronobiforma cellulositropha TaxID=1679076 RepID=UPI0021D5BB2E|nr:Hsp20/alpha crystallin family protein [Natronobiforma cellulositropha]